MPIALALFTMATKNFAPKTFVTVHKITARPNMTIDFIRKSIIGPRGDTINRLKNEVCSRYGCRPFVFAEGDSVTIRSESKTSVLLMKHLIEKLEREVSNERVVYRQTYEVLDEENVGRIMGRDGHRTKTMAQQFRVHISFGTLIGGRGSFLVSGYDNTAVTEAIASLRESEEHIMAQKANTEVVSDIDVNSVLMPETITSEPVDVTHLFKSETKPESKPVDVTHLFRGYALAAAKPPTPKVITAPVETPAEPKPKSRIPVLKDARISDIADLIQKPSAEPPKKSWADMMDEEDELAELSEQEYCCDELTF